MPTAVSSGARVPRYNFDPRIGALTPFERACRNVAVAVAARAAAGGARAPHGRRAAVRRA